MAQSRSPQLVCAEDIIEFTLDDEPINQNGRPMYSERAIHGALYRARPEVGSVCHNHSLSVMPFGVTGTELRPIMHCASSVIVCPSGTFAMNSATAICSENFACIHFRDDYARQINSSHVAFEGVQVNQRLESRLI
jgi:hypothetical protein